MWYKFKVWLRNKLWEFLELDEALASVESDCNDYTERTIANQDFVDRLELHDAINDLGSRIDNLE